MSDSQQRKPDPPPGEARRVPPWLVELEGSVEQIPIEPDAVDLPSAEPKPPMSPDSADLTLAAELPSWAELPRLEVSDQASMIIALRLPTPPPEQPPAESMTRPLATTPPPERPPAEPPER